MHTNDIDNQDSGYLGMAVQPYVQVHLAHCHMLTQKGYSQKQMAQLKSMLLSAYVCITSKTCRKHIQYNHV